MSRRATRLNKADIAHPLRSAAAICGCSTSVIVGTGAVVARAGTIPPDPMQTREIDIDAPDVKAARGSGVRPHPP